MPFLHILMLAICVLFSSGAFALEREVANAFITNLTIGTNNGDLLFIRVNPAPVPTGNCHNNSSWHFVLDLSTSVGKHMYAAILAIDAAGRPINFSGSDSCSLFSGIETLRAIGRSN